MNEVILKNRKTINIEKLLSFGFENAENGYVYHTDIVGGTMSMTVTVLLDGKVASEIIDKSTEEEYVLHLVPDAGGSFVGQVKAEYEAVIDDISAKCFDFEVFGSKQAKEVIAYIRDKYGDELEFLWQRFPDNAVVRRKDSQKWYAAILTVSRLKLGMDSAERVEVIDLRMKTEDIEKTVDNKKYLPGYHMNKKHWITVCLDGTVGTEEIFTRIDDSYAYAIK